MFSIRSISVFASIFLLLSGSACSQENTGNSTVSLPVAVAEDKTLSLHEAKELTAKFLAFVRSDSEFTSQELRDTLTQGEKGFDPSVGAMWEFSGSLGVVGVAVATGEIVSFQAADELEDLASKVSLPQAKQKMKEFLREVYPQFDETRFELVESEESDGRFHFSLEQIRLPNEVSIFHNYIAVSLCADEPQVVSFDRSALTFIRVRPPVLGEKKAKTIIQEIVGPAGRMTELNIREQPLADLSGAVTVWAASVLYEYGGIESLEMVMINADTGEQVVIEE